jgi:hypothetical protein
LDEVSQTLWRERELIDLLVCKLEVEQLVLASGRTRWLSAVTREVEYVLGEIKQFELVRSILVDAAGEQLGLLPGATLRDLAEAAPSPWDGIFEQHRVAFLRSTDELRALARVNRDLLARGARAVQEALGWLCETAEQNGPDVYSSSGATAVALAGPRLVDGRL